VFTSDNGRVFGKKWSEYIQFERWILILIAAVWAVRLGLSLTGTSFSVIRWVSINIVLLVGLVYCSVVVHTSGFGSYKQLLALLFLQTAFAHLLIAAAIVLGIVTCGWRIPVLYGKSTVCKTDGFWRDPRRIGFHPAGVSQNRAAKRYCRCLGSMESFSTRDGRALKFVRLLCLSAKLPRTAIARDHPYIKV